MNREMVELFIKNFRESADVYVSDYVYDQEQSPEENLKSFVTMYGDYMWDIGMHVYMHRL
jgi:hypothetical protein